MKIKNDDVLLLYETLQRLVEDKELKLNITVGYIMAKNKTTLEPIANLIYDTRRNIILEYGTTDGEEVQIPKDKIDELNEKVVELMNIENDLDLIQVPIKMLEESKLNFEDIIGLTYMIQPFDISEILISDDMVN